MTSGLLAKRGAEAEAEAEHSGRLNGGRRVQRSVGRGGKLELLCLSLSKEVDAAR